MDDYDLIWSVDDDEEMSQAIGMMIKLLGFRFRSFDGARPAARALLQGERWHCLPNFFPLFIIAGFTFSRDHDT